MTETLNRLRMLNTTAKSNKGFTLVELSIVIVIVGLIVAGVAAGQALVKQSKSRRIISDVTQIRVAFNSFKLQYNAAPGDMRNARSFFTNCVADSGINSCNGDGDGLIELSWGAVSNYEPIRALEHLYLSGLWKFSVSAMSSDYTCGRQFFSGVQAPKTPMGGTSAYYFGRNDIGFLPNSRRNMRENFLIMGADAPATCDPPMNPIFTGKEAYNIDSKTDDGLPYRGKVITERGNFNPSCSSLGTSPYDLSSSTAICTMFFAM